jgi:hypothetical protein
MSTGCCFSCGLNAGNGRSHERVVSEYPQILYGWVAVGGIIRQILIPVTYGLDVAVEGSL